MRADPAARESEPPPRRALAGIPLAGWVGLAFTLAFMGVMLYAVPAVRWFFLLSVPPGLLIGGFLYWLNRRRD
jgi:hypothetical protein